MISKPRNDITGNIYHSLKVYKMIKGVYCGRSQFMASCTCLACGKTDVICYPSSLKSGDKKSCGCLSRKRPSLVGKTFGYLEVISLKRVSKKNPTKNNRYDYYCICTCHNCGKKNHRVISSSLVRGCTKSCGCSTDHHTKLVGEKHPSFTGYEEIPGYVFGSIRKGAVERNIPFDIDIKYIWDLYIKQKRKCALSNIDIEFKMGNKNRSKSTASLDRIDSSKGYVEGNVQWVHKDVNRMKWSLDQKVFIDFCNRISENFKNIS